GLGGGVMPPLFPPILPEPPVLSPPAPLPPEPPELAAPVPPDVLELVLLGAGAHARRRRGTTPDAIDGHRLSFTVPPDDLRWRAHKIRSKWARQRPPTRGSPRQVRLSARVVALNL